MEPPVDEYSVLLFGETGVGKSTFINACDAYIKYSTLDDALNSETLCCRLPVKFQWQNEDYIDEVVQFGYDENENLDSCTTSATKSPRIHSYKFQNKIYHFIDTCGFNDTNGFEAERKNISNMFNFLKGRCSYIHALCILLKPDENRESLRIRYSINKLLSLFHRDICKNIIFVYTHSSGTDFKLNSTDTILKSIFTEIESNLQGVCILSTTGNKFLLDNNCFKYLVAVKCNVDSASSREIHARCWNTSANTCYQLLNYIQSLPVQLIERVMSVNEFRFKLEETFFNKVEEINKEIDCCKLKMKECMKVIKQCRYNIEQLKSFAFDYVVTIQKGPYHMICNNKFCSKRDDYIKNEKACCANCIAWFKTFCNAFVENKCIHCKCSIEIHSWLQGVLQQKEERRNFKTETLIKKEEKLLQSKLIEEISLCHMDSKLEKKEMNIYNEMREQVGFLKKSAIVIYSKDFIEHLKMEIKTGPEKQHLERYLNKYIDLYKYLKIEY